jgi:hypothetical protein
MIQTPKVAHDFAFRILCILMSAISPVSTGTTVLELSVTRFVYDLSICHWQRDSESLQELHKQQPIDYLGPLCTSLLDYQGSKLSTNFCNIYDGKGEESVYDDKNIIGVADNRV